MSTATALTRSARYANYVGQTGRAEVTPRQRRRLQHKHNHAEGRRLDSYSGKHATVTP